jgi:hypothetical protein
MKNTFPLFAVPLILLAPFALFACETEDATYAVIDNDYPSMADGGDPTRQTTVYKVWWSSSLFSAPVAAETESDQGRVVSSGDFAYVLLAPGWDPTSADPPTILVAAKTRDSLFVKRGDTLHIRISDATVVGNCGAPTSGPLSQDDADFITQRIFPAEFQSGTYDAKTCSLRVPINAGDAAAQD